MPEPTTFFSPEPGPCPTDVETARMQRVLSGLAKDLRTPLMLVRGSLELLSTSAGELRQDDIRRLLEMAADNTLRLVRMVSALSGMPEGRDTLLLNPCGVVRLVETARAMAGPAAERVRISMPPLSGRAVVLADLDRLAGSLACLVQATVSTGGLGAAPELSVRRGRCDLLISVRVGGETALPSVRDPQVAACERVVQAHGGEFWVEHPAGTGGAFHLSLPLAAGRRRPPLHLPRTHGTRAPAQ